MKPFARYLTFITLKANSLPCKNTALVPSSGAVLSFNPPVHKYTSLLPFLLVTLLLPLELPAVGGGHEGLMQQESDAMQAHLREQGIASPRAEGKARRLVNAGKKHQARAGNYDDSERARRELDKAIRKYQAALEINPQSLEAEIRLAEIFIEIKNFPEALSASTRSLELMPGNAYGLQLRGTALLELEKLEHARYIYGVLTELDHHIEAAALLETMREWHNRQERKGESGDNLKDDPEYQSFSSWLTTME